VKEKAVNMSNLTKRKKDLFEMKSVVFKDISKQQSEKAQKRKRLLQLMNQYPDWASQKNKLIMQEIQELGQAIGIKTHPIHQGRIVYKKRVSLFNLARLFR